MSLQSRHTVNHQQSARILNLKNIYNVSLKKNYAFERSGGSYLYAILLQFYLLLLTSEHHFCNIHNYHNAC